MAKTTLPNTTFIPQLYLGGIGSKERDWLPVYLDLLKKYGVDYVLLHGFPQEMHEHWEGRAKVATDRELKPMVAWGVDGHAAGAAKGALMGEVLAHADCVAGCADAEDDSANEHDVLAMGEAARSREPNKPVIDQSWFAMKSHGVIWPKPRGVDDGYVLRGFPEDELRVKLVNAGTYRQLYCNGDYYKAHWGDARYEHCAAWMDRDWAEIEPALDAAGLSQPLGVTVQMYEWSLPDLVACAIDRGVSKGMPTIGWSEPSHALQWVHSMPHAPEMSAMLFVMKLIELGHAAPGVDSVAAVKAFQEEFNKGAAAGKSLDVDGLAGPKTIAAAGCWLNASYVDDAIKRATKPKSAKSPKPEPQKPQE